MKTLLHSLSVLLLALTSASFVKADQPPNVGSADVFKPAECFGQILVGPPGSFLPFIDGVYGVLIAKQGEGRATVSNSARGNRSLTCQGKIEVGSTIEGWDPAAQQFATGTIVPIEEACDALRFYGLGDACRSKGKGKGSIIVNPLIDGLLCNIGGLLTENWHTVFTNGETTMVRCAGKE